MLRGIANLIGGGSTITGTTITATTAFRSADGSAAATAYGFTAAANTGFFAVSTADIGVSVSSTERYRFGSGGRFSIGGEGVAIGTSVAGPDVFATRYAAKQLMISGDGSTQNGTVLSGLHSLAASTESTVSIALTANKKVKSVTAIANNVATDTITVTVPNAAHSASLKLRINASLGAGGAIGANEASGTISYDVAIARTAGVATVATLSSAYGSATSAVAGAATITVTAAASAMTGAVGATQTFTIQVTIARGSGSSDNHTCQVLAEIINANATGVTIS